MILGASLERNALLYPQRPATIEEDGRTVSHAAFRDMAWRVANGLARQGIGNGARVGVLSRNCAEFLIAYFAIGSIGAWMVPLNPGMAIEDLDRRMAHAEVQALLVSADLVAVPAQLSAAVRANLHGRVFVHGGECGAHLAWDELVASGRLARPDAQVSYDDTLYLAYTSGTTGAPKGVLVPHRAIVSGFLYKAVAYQLTDADVSLNAGPYWHSAPLDFASMAVYLGGTALIQARFEARAYLDTVQRHRATNTFVVPTMLLLLLEELERNDADLASLRCIVSGGAPLPTATKERVLRRFGPVLNEFYGATESRSLAYITAEELRTRRRCVGRPNRDVQIRILDEAGTDVPADGVGEIFVRGPGIFNGYYKDEARTRAAFRDGWFSLGDMGRLDEEGYLYLVDRKNDMLITGGENVYPNDVEDVLRLLPGVREAAVVGIPDARWGEKVAAFVVAAPGASLDGGEIELLCRARLPAYMVPRHIEIVGELPRNAMGKVLRRALRAPFWDKQESTI